MIIDGTAWWSKQPKQEQPGALKKPGRTAWKYSPCTRTCGKAADHGAEALRYAGDGAAVRAVVANSRKGIQHCVAGHAHVVKPHLGGAQDGQ